MGAAGDEAERGFGAEPVEHGLETVRGAVEIESVGIADDQVDLAVEVGLKPRPVALDDMRDVVMVAPVSGDGGVDFPGRAVETRAGAPAGPTGRAAPSEARDHAPLGAAGGSAP